MAVTVKNGGTFTTGQDGQRPGMYVRFIEKAIAAIGIGARSKVATLKSTLTGGTAQTGKVYRVSSMADAATIFGPDNIEDIGYMFMGGASEVVVVTVASTADTTAQLAALQKLETYDYHVFVVPATTLTGLPAQVYTWVKQCRDNGKNFIAVFYGTKETDVAAAVTEAKTFADEYCVYVNNGVKNAVGVDIPASKYAAFIAGTIAGTALDGSLTYLEVPFADVITRYRSADIQTLLAAGALVTGVDGDIPQIVQGLTLGDGSFSKIRTVRAKQAMIDDIDKAVNDNYIGKITNNADGQIAVINAIKTYLTTLANANVIDTEFSVELDKTIPSIGSEMYININVRFLDAIEYVYLTITL